MMQQIYSSEKSIMTDSTTETDDVIIEKATVNVPPVIRVPVKHTNLGIRSHAMDMSTMVELTSFSSLGKIQPFLVTLSTTAALIVDLHCHLNDKEVCGYLGGHWDINAHNLTISFAFPCRCQPKDKVASAAVEAEIARTMERMQLTLVGWYHSHPRTHASPSLRDVDSQLDYQIKMKGLSDNSYTPCVGLICSPYNTDSNCYESNTNIFWSLPPSENRPHEYPRPMLLSYTLSQEQFLLQEAMDEIKKCAEHYKGESTIDFSASFNGNVTYLEKLKSSLASKLPRSQSNDNYWDIIREIVAPGTEDPPASSQPSIITSSSDLFSSVKFPLVNDPMGRSGLNTNNVFLPPMNFKLDTSVSILKPFGIPSTSKDKSDTSDASKGQKHDQESSNMASKHKLPTEFTSGELTVSVKSSKLDYEPSGADFTKVSNLLNSDSSASNKNRIPDFPLADISQLSKFTDLSKLANFSTADLAKLSGFSINDLAKSSPAYACNLANLFTPLNAKGKDVTLIDVVKPSDFTIPEFKPSDVSFKPSDISFKSSDISYKPSDISFKPAELSFKPVELSFKPCNMFKPAEMTYKSSDSSKLNLSSSSEAKSVDDFSHDQKGPSDLSDGQKTRSDYGSDDVSVINVNPEFGSMVDMTTHHKKSAIKQAVDNSETLNLSKDHA